METEIADFFMMAKGASRWWAIGSAVVLFLLVLTLKYVPTVKVWMAGNKWWARLLIFTASLATPVISGLLGKMPWIEVAPAAMIIAFGATGLDKLFGGKSEAPVPQ